MSYGSVISQKGSAARNVGPVLDTLGPYIGSGSETKRVLELASFPYEHIRAYAARWPGVHFTGTCRDADEIAEVNTDDLPANLTPPHRLDIAHEDDWASLRRVMEPQDGVIMLNLVHCTPEGFPEHVFRNLSPRTDEGRALLRPGGWIVAYGAYLNDDGTFRSAGDEQFDREHIKAVHPSLGLRTPASITAMANKWGFVEEKRVDMPKGNLMIFWRAEQSTKPASL